MKDKALERRRVVEKIEGLMGNKHEWDLGVRKGEADIEIAIEVLPFMPPIHEFVPSPCANPDRKVPDSWRSTIMEDLVKRHGLTIKHHNRPAKYDGETEEISIMNIGQYKSATAYYKTLAHEMIHWTFRRTNPTSFEAGSMAREPHARSELVAEIGSVLLIREVGFRSEQLYQNSATYIKGWLKDVEGDPRQAIEWATIEAGKAVDYLLGREAA